LLDALVIGSMICRSAILLLLFLAISVRVSQFRNTQLMTNFRRISKTAVADAHVQTQKVFPRWTPRLIQDAITQRPISHHHYGLCLFESIYSFLF
jgi:hypothetical protein